MKLIKLHSFRITINIDQKGGRLYCCESCQNGDQ